jgi:hypothetical protein
MSNQGGGVNISGMVGTIDGDIIGGNKIIINIVNPIGKIIEGETPPGPNMYVDRKRKFSISWPKDLDWIPSSRMGAYQLSQLGVTASQKLTFFFGLFKMETQATFAIFKIQRPEGACVGWVIIHIYSQTIGMKMPWLVGLVAVWTLRQMRDSGCEIISENVTRSWDGRSFSETPPPEIIYRQTDGHPVIVRIIRGGRHVYSVNSPIYPPTSAYDNLRQDTNTILNSFTLLN